MQITDIIEFLVFIILVTALVKPIGNYMSKVFEGEKTFLSIIFLPIEKLIYKVSKIHPSYEMNWKEFAISMLIFNAIGFIVLFLILIFQQFLPLNPQHLKGFNLDLAFNTAVSFITNTNWQAYSGESTASYFSQMLGFAVLNFLSAVTGIVILLAIIRGFARKQTSNLGNF